MQASLQSFAGGRTACRADRSCDGPDQARRV